MWTRQPFASFRAAGYLILVVATLVVASACHNPTTDPTSTTPATLKGGTFGPGKFSLSSQSCTPAFFNSSFTGSVILSADLTQLSVIDPNGAPRNSTGSFTGGVGHFTGQGLIGTHSANWSTTVTLNDTAGQINVSVNVNPESIVIVDVQNCIGSYMSEPLHLVPQ